MAQKMVYRCECISEPSHIMNIGGGGGDDFMAC